MLEHQRAVEFEVLDVAQAVTSLGACERSQQLVEPRLAVDQRQRLQIGAIKHEQIEAVRHHVVVARAGV